MCCGQKRAVVTQEIIKPATARRDSNWTPPAATPIVHNVPRSPSVAQPQAGWSSLQVRYLERSPIRVRGPATGKEYDFSGSNPVRLIDVRDAEALLRTRFFAKAG